MAVRRARLAVLALLAATLLPRELRATQRWGPIQLSGNLQSQNLIRHPDIDDFQFIQNRNTAHVRFEYEWLQGGKAYSRYSIPFIERSNLFLLWRGVYDSIYDTTPGFVEKEDIHGKAYAGLNVNEFGKQVRGMRGDAFEISGLNSDARDALKWDNQLREAYVDLKFRGLPLSVRAGKQQIVWGESDNFRMLDRANALDLTWHLVQELPPPAFGWDEIRRTYWMFKFLYDLGNVWKLSQSFLEWYWNPGDWRPAKIAYLPRPWGLRFYDPLTNPVDGGFIGGTCDLSNLKVTGRVNRGLGYCTRLMNGTKLFEQGDYHRNPLENSQVGVRYHGILPRGLEFTLNYFYQRFAGDDGTPFAPIRALSNTPANRQRAFQQLFPRGIFAAEYIAPYVHTIGASANYSDEAYTQTVFRFETIYDVGIPFFDVAKVTVIPTPALPGVTKKNMWKGMIAFDRPTWIRTLNKKSTIFLSGQFFWHYLVNNPGCEAMDVGTAGVREKRRVGSCLVGGFDLPSRVRVGTPESPAFRDKVRDWEALASVAAFTFYRGGSLLPVIGIAVDPVNKFGMEPFWSLDYVVRDDVTVNLTQRYFVTPYGRSTPNFDPWGFQAISAGRSETSIRLSYQF
jgi:hypothetical protein